MEPIKPVIKPSVQKLPEIKQDPSVNTPKGIQQPKNIEELNSRVYAAVLGSAVSAGNRAFLFPLEYRSNLQMTQPSSLAAKVSATPVQQAQSARGVFQSLKPFFQNNFKGVGTTVIGAAIKGGLMTTAGKAVNTALPEDLPGRSSFVAFSMALANASTQPINVARTQAQLNPQGIQGYGKELIKGDIRLSSLFSGIGPIAARNATWQGINTNLYQSFIKGDESNMEKFVVGQATGMTASAASFPLNTIGTIQQKEAGEGIFRSTFTIGKKLVAKEGVSRLFRGFPIAASRMFLAIPVSTIINDQVFKKEDQS